jgi:hypothetical protein
MKQPKVKGEHNPDASSCSPQGMFPLRFKRCACILLLALTTCGAEPPTGVTRADLQGVWSGTFNGVTLLGRTLTGEVDWVFNSSTFEIRFLDPPAEQSERIVGDWKFADGKVALTLRTSFPIESDIGATDTLFVAISGGEISIKTSSGSDILLLKTQAVLRIDPDLHGETGLTRVFGPLSPRRGRRTWAGTPLRVGTA